MVAGMAEYIERDDALMALSYYHIGEPDPADIIPAVLDTERKSIAKINAADVAPVRHGRWIMRGGKRYCSECRNRACVTRDSDDFWYTVGTDFCPNCGAKMDGEQ